MVAPQFSITSNFKENMTTNNKIIYLVPEPNTEGFKVGYQDNTVDLPFDITSERVCTSSATYKFSLGCRTYAPPEAGALFLLPRSKTAMLHDKEGIEEWIIPSATDDEVTAYLSNSLRLANTIGVIDASYRGIWIAFCQFEGRVKLLPGVTYLQAMPQDPSWSIKIVESIADVPEHLRVTERGEGSFGSTDEVKK